MADRKYPYRVGTAAGAAINAESSLRALRDARLRRANFSGDLAIKNARDTAASAIRTSRSALQGAIRNAEEIGSRNISEAARQARLAIKPAVDFAVREGRSSVAAAEAAKAAAVTKAGTMTGMRGAILKTGDAIRGAVGGETAKKIGSTIASLPSRLGVSVGGISDVAGAVARSKAAAPARLMAKVAEKPIVGYLNAVEKAGTKVFTGRGLVGGLGRAMTSAKGNAIGFAVGSWIDAGLEAYDFFKEGGGKDTAGPIKWFGKGKDPSDPDGVFSNPEFYRSYFAEVGKKLQSTITFGFFGDDNGVIDRFFGNDEESVKARDKARQDAFDASVEADPVIAEYRRMQKTHRDRMGAATALPSGYLSPEMGVRRYISDLSAERDKALSRGGLTDRGRENLEKKYAGYIGEALKNEASKIISDQNRAQYYGLVTGGRDYAKDYELSGKDPNAVRGFSEFNERWGKFSDEDKVLYNHEEAWAAFDEARRRRMMGEGN